MESVQLAVGATIVAGAATAMCVGRCGTDANKSDGLPVCDSSLSEWDCDCTL
eukprot:SAG31_NODE_11460_length_1027_cov_1.817888_1_plen_51_part_01